MVDSKMRGADEKRPAFARREASAARVSFRGRARARDFLVFDDLSLVETAEAGSFDCRDVDKYIFAAALFASCGLESQNGSPDCCPMSFLRTHEP